MDFFDKDSEKLMTRYGYLNFIYVLFGIYFAVSNSIFLNSLGIFETGIMIAVAIIVSSYLLTVKRRSIKGNEDYVRWVAFKRFLEDFSSFDDYPIPSLVIWEHYLVYATAFGIADKVEKQLRIKFKKEGESYSPEYQRTITVYTGYNRYMNYRLTRSIVSANTTIAEAAAKSSSGKIGGGGGFSGGRSFGGGGGGFRGR